MSEIATNEYYRLYKIHPQGAATKEIEVYRKVNAIEIPDNATNGDMIMAMFPSWEIDMDDAEEEYPIVTCWIDRANIIWTSFDLTWWNAPYKGGQGK